MEGSAKLEKGFGALAGFIFAMVVIFAIIYIFTKSFLYSVMGAIIFVIVIWIILREMKVI